ncbi:MAG: HAD family hydrolase [Acidobacteria bacterium]|nr:HAD family hydrolase [Acidobacteriota bacterium]
MRRYTGVLFDLFDTLIDFDRGKLPWVEVGDRLVWTAGSPVFDHLIREGVDCTPDQFMEASELAYREIEGMRSEENREFPSRLRFQMFLERLGVARPPTELVEELVSVHMVSMIESLIYPRERAALLRRLEPQYRIGVVSNFDHAPTAHKALARGGYALQSGVVAISDEVGWRKPDARIFRFALERLELTPAETLFVGDNFHCDVLGPMALGMDSAWLRRGKSLPDDGTPPPRHLLDSFSDLEALLGC